MEERNYSDEQIRTEIRKTLENKELRKCFQCYHGSDCRECAKLHIPITKYQYSGHCQHYITNEDMLVEQARESLARLELEEKKVNHILTMTLNHIEAAMLFLEDFASRVEKEYQRAEIKGTGDARVRKNDRQWISTLKRAYKNMLQGMEGVRRQYTHFIEPQLNKVFFDKDTKVYNAEQYDDHLSDANELARLSLLYFDKAFQNIDNANKVFYLLSSLEGCGVMDENDYKRYELRR